MFCQSKECALENLLTLKAISEKKVKGKENKKDLMFRELKCACMGQFKLSQYAGTLPSVSLTNFSILGKEDWT